MNNEDYKIAYENVMIANKMLEQENKQLKEELENDIDRYEDTISYQLGFDKGKEYLQQENKQLKERNKELEDGFKSATDELCEYATKLDKAIEYIKENASYGIQEKCCLDDLNYYDCDKLLEILGDKENE